MARLFAPVDFVADDISAPLVDALLALPSDVVVMLEFYSPGKAGRQVDVAVLGPYGIDVVEVKDIRGGAVVASENGPWWIEQDDGRSQQLRLNHVGGYVENPYQQVKRTAGDLERGLRQLHGLPSGVKVYPSVLIPQSRQATRMGKSGFVWGINGVERLDEGLRSLRPWRNAGELSVDRRFDLPTRLDLTEVGVAYVEGRVVEGVDHSAVAGARVRIGTGDVVTDDRGRFRAAVADGTHRISVTAPGMSEALEFEGSFHVGPNDELDIAVVRGGASEGFIGPDVEALVEELAKLIAISRAQHAQEREEREAFLDLVGEEFERLADTAERWSTAGQDDRSNATSGVEDDEGVVRQALARLAERTGDDVSSLAVSKGMELVAAYRELGPRHDIVSSDGAVTSAAAHVTTRTVPRRDAPVRHGPARTGAPFLVHLLSVAVVVSLLAFVGFEVFRQGPSSGPPAISASETLEETAGSSSIEDSAEMPVESDAIGGAADVPPNGGLAPSATVVQESTDGPVPTSDRVASPASVPSSEPVTATDPAGAPEPSADSVGTLPGAALPERAPQAPATRSGLPGVVIAPAESSWPHGTAPIGRNDCPESHPLKGNVADDGEMIYHAPGQRYYDATLPETCFADADDATGDGFRASLR